ncbi:hypothetical protein CDD81_387 [Ophiocordyceps australis]|uniref:Major facilitator superfamily (MFS) profile domain-containing protein n=1 Tax=Ophiocordyceps australis TaxID=1399860 RepID=A0A2C5Y164_9HYPO|nr:hypothetical protein CDD81_387 [Ophiocordyceps australis]
MKNSSMIATDDYTNESCEPEKCGAKCWAQGSPDDVLLSRQETNELRSKIDRRLLPLLCVLYLLSCLDRSNLGNAKRAGLGEDLNFIGKQNFNVAISVFFPSYLVVQIPSNLCLRYTRPCLQIPTLMVAWSIVVIAMAFVKNFEGLVVTRCALGLAEGGVFPGLVYYLTRWYRRDQYGLRIAILFSAAVVGGSFNGFLGHAIMAMHGLAGLHGWSWLFIIEGTISLCIAGLAYRLMYDYPDKAKFLSRREKQAVLQRLEQDGSCPRETFDFSAVRAALLDWKIWMHMVMTLGISIPLYSIAEFMPQVITDLGFSHDQAVAMAIPPHVAACIFVLAGGWATDRYQQRGIFIIGFCVLACIGFAVLSTAQDNAVRYAACFLVTMGIYPIVPQDIAWNANNICGSTKRAVGIAMHIGFGNLGGAVAAFIIRQDDARRFITGHGILLLVTAASCLLAVFMTWHLRQENNGNSCRHQTSKLDPREKLAVDRQACGPLSFRYLV